MCVRSVAERNRLVLENDDLVRHAVRRHYRYPLARRLGYDDCLQAGRLGLVYAAEHWDAAKIPRFQGYAYWKILYFVADATRHLGSVSFPIRGLKRPCVARENVTRIFATAPLLEATAPLVADPLEVLDRELDVQSMLQKLHTVEPRQQRLLQRRYLDGLTVEEVAVAEGLSRCYCNTLIGQAIQKLRESFAGYAEY